MSTTNTVNGHPQRKQLSDQLDRFDALLDGLSEGLTDSIADAVRDGTRLALKDALVEILTDLTLRSKLQQAVAPERSAPVPVPAPRPGIFSWLKAKAVAVLNGAKAVAGTVAAATVHAAATGVSAVRHPARLMQLIGGLKHLFYVGAGAGLAIAIVSFFAPHVISAALSGISGGVAAMAIRAIVWTRRTFTSISFA